MRQRQAIVVAAGAALATFGLAWGVGLRADDAADDMKKMAGRWKVVSMRQKGRDAPKEFCDAVTFEFAPGKMKVVNAKRQQGKESTFAVQLDAAPAPRHLDAAPAPKGAKTLAIYEWAGARLKLALPKAGAARPDDFAAAAKQDVNVFTLEKDGGP